MNPFAKRATEYYRDDSAFLSVITPEPLITFFAGAAEQDALFDRLVAVIGTPGSGKTTIARLFQYSVLRALLNQGDSEPLRPLRDALVRCKAIRGDQPLVAGWRLPLEAEYRDFWELPYPEEFRFNLMRAMIQARAVLGWMRTLDAAGATVERVRFTPRTTSDAAVEAIGGVEGQGVLARAQQVERAIYRVSAALIAPNLSDIDLEAISAYRPFDVISEIVIVEPSTTLTLRPLLILDDAHSLHPQQLEQTVRWLLQREIRVSRWILTRLDALSPSTVLIDSDSAAGQEEAPLPGVQQSRDITTIRLQGATGVGRGKERRQFRSMAQDMANRYLAQMQVFSRRQVREFSRLLDEVPEMLSPGQLKKLQTTIETRRDRLKLRAEPVERLKKQVESYLAGADVSDKGRDVGLAMLEILMERYAARTPQRNLFGADSEPEPNRPVKADGNVADRAKIALWHQFGRPIYFGFESLCDTSSENAERFLRLAEKLVDRSETQIIRGRPMALSAGVQHALLRERADEIVNKDWNFPFHREVKALCEAIAQACLARTLEPTAPDGPSGTAIPDADIARIVNEHPRLARVLQYGVAYNAFSLQRDRSAKDQKWCVIELSGVLILKYGLTLQRGHFVEWDVDKLNSALPKE